jgi:hypothetical protein
MAFFRELIYRKTRTIFFVYITVEAKYEEEIFFYGCVAAFLLSLASLAFGQKVGLRPAAPALYRSFPEAVASLTTVEEELPAEVQLSSLLLPRNQQSLGACASFATVAEMTRWERLRNGWQVGLNRTYFSPLFLYSQIDPGFDRGSSFFDNLQLLIEKGAPLWATFPYVPDISLIPPPNAYREAAKFKIEEWRRLPSIDTDTFRLWLAKGFGIMATFRVDTGFFSYKSGIYRHSPGSGENDFGFHGATILDYSDHDRTFTVINSYGPGWGQNQGFFHISYDDVSALIPEAYIMIPKSHLPDVNPPVRVEAGRGAYKSKIKIFWDPNGADEYEIWRLGDNESYTSLGKTAAASFTDQHVSTRQHYYYFVSTHKGD